MRAAQFAAGGKLDTGAEKFLKEVLWREFLLSPAASLAEPAGEAVPAGVRGLPLERECGRTESLAEGPHGYPIVDAGMRELWATGFMHNRVRMITASFLIKDLLVPWTEGERWFWDTLVDADIGNNAASWQWVAGCGADAAPYFRVFNPVLQGLKFDPKGAYVRQWVRNSRDCPTIHPQAVGGVFARAGEAGVELGRNYPILWSTTTGPRQGARGVSGDQGRGMTKSSGSAVRCGGPPPTPGCSARPGTWRRRMWRWKSPRFTAFRCSTRTTRRNGKPDAVKALDAKIRAADGIVIACPEYNFSIPGVLKNATDWLSRGGSPFRWKRVGIIGAGGGQFVGTARSQYHFRQNLQALQAITMPRPEVFVNHNEEKFDADGNLTDAETKRYLAKWLEAFLEWVEKRP